MKAGSIVETRNRTWLRDGQVLGPRSIPPVGRKRDDSCKPKVGGNSCMPACEPTRDGRSDDIHKPRSTLSSCCVPYL
jgi:hypothetical protein